MSAPPLAGADGAAPVAVSVVIVNWNGGEDLEECLASLRAQTLAEPFEVVVVDNASEDDSLAVLERQRPPVRLIRNSVNRGFAAGCNQGIEGSGGEFVALLNADAVVEPAWLEELVARLRATSAAGAAASRILSYDRRSVFDNAGHVLHGDGLTRGRGRLEPDRGQFDAVEEVFCFSGCAALLRRSMLDDVGLFDESFFAYCEDADLGFRARLRGWSCVYVPSAVVYHKYSRATGAYSPLKALNVERNRVWLAVKNLPLTLLLASPAFTAMRYFWQAWGALAGRGASGRFVRERSALGLVAILLRAYLEALRGLPRALRQRRIIQARRTVRSVEVWSWLRRFGIGSRRMALTE